MSINKLFSNMNKVARTLNNTAKAGRDIRDIATGDIDNLVKRKAKSSSMKKTTKAINKFFK